MMLRCDPSNGRITHLRSDPHDPPETLRLIQDLLKGLALVPKQAAPLATSAVCPPDVPSEHAAAAAPAIASRWLSETIDHWLRDCEEEQPRRKHDHVHVRPSAQGVQGTDQPQVRANDFNNVSTWDVRIGDITTDQMDQFVNTFWSFPDRRGRRKHADAREILAEAGPAQSRNNALKNFGYVRMFIKWADKREEISSSVRARLEAALEDATPESRAGYDHQPLSPDDELGEGGGYVAFTHADVKRMFGGPEFLIYAARNAARYWIALLGLFVGLRINEASQLRTRDFRQHEAVWVRRRHRIVAGQERSANVDRDKAAGQDICGASGCCPFTRCWWSWGCWST